MTASEDVQWLLRQAGRRLWRISSCVLSSSFSLPLPLENAGSPLLIPRRESPHTAPTAQTACPNTSTPLSSEAPSAFLAPRCRPRLIQACHLRGYPGCRLRGNQSCSSLLTQARRRQRLSQGRRSQGKQALQPAGKSRSAAAAQSRQLFVAHANPPPFAAQACPPPPAAIHVPLWVCLHLVT